MSWDDVLGQESAKQMLQAHLAAGRVAQAYLFAGPDGVGKRRLAIALAKALNCEALRASPQGGIPSDPRQRRGESRDEALRASLPCDACATCAQIIRGIHPDLHVLAPGGPSDLIRIDAIRQLLSRVALRPYHAAAQVAIIDGAERLTEEAANSLLKALEEPSSRTRFVLTTSRLSDCLPTIVSRCQLIRCRPLPADMIARILIEAQQCAPPSAESVARLSGGSAAQAIELAGCWEAYEAVLARLGGQGLSGWMEQPLPETRQDVARLLDAMLGWWRDVAMAAAGRPQAIAHAEQGAAVRRQAEAVDLDRCLEAAAELIGLRESLEQFVSPRLVAALAREKWLFLTTV